jgi:serine/threonine-protein kinase
MSDHGPTVFKDRYEVHRKLARGGMSDVYLARDRVLDRPVALKVLFPEYAKDTTFVARFRREAQSAARLNHPNIVGVYDWGEENGTYFIAMEFIEGHTLSEIVRAEGPMNPRRAAEATADVAAALGFAHRNGVIHRDIKPGNVMVETTGLVKVADFGIAQAIGGPEQTQLTRVGSVMGTATYFSPEQAQGRQVDPRSDIYSLGCVLFEILTGRPPFTGDTPVAIAYKHVQEAPPRPSQFANVPPGLDAIVLKCLAKTPDGRYSSSEELRTDLRRFLEGHPVAAMAGAAAAGAAAATAAYGAADATAAYASPATGMNPGYGADATSALPVTGAHGAYPPPTGATGAAGPYGGAPLDDKKSANPWLIGALVLFLLLVAGGLILTVVRMSDGSAATVKVPDLTGQQCDVALPTLTKFKAVCEPRVNQAVPPGQIFDQEPKPQKEVREGTALTLIVSAGPDVVDVDDVRNKSFDEANRILVGKGFQVGRVDAPHDVIPKDQVISQTPEGGTKYGKGLKVTLTVSLGKTAVNIPEVSGLPTAAALERLRADGFTVTNTTSEPSEFPKGRVIRTNPPANTPYDKTKPVTVFESSGPAPTTTTPTTVPSTTTSTTTRSSSTTRSTIDTTSTTDRD